MSTSLDANVPDPRPRRLRTLHVEDNPDDCELIRRELIRGGYDPVLRRVETAEELKAALTGETWDVILSDHSLPSFSSPEAFAVVRGLNLDIPFIIISGTVGEEIAVEAMRSGVHDFLLKGQLLRLSAAIERELREAAMRVERRRIQEQLLISERMASVGTLAAGVAHEINNPLAVVAGNLHVIREEIETLSRELETPAGDLDDGDGAASARRDRVSVLIRDLREAVSDADEAAERVRVIVRDLRVFSRSDEDRTEPVDVQRVLESSLRMARNEIRPRARVVRRFDPIPSVDGNEPRLGQVFLNLLVNAAQAIPEGQVDRNEITVSTRLERGLVVVEVADSGAGIPPEVLPRIFDAFFTTKPIGVGTGLGLTICHRILASMSGGIEVESEVGRGTRFRVMLAPARLDEAEEVTQVPPAPGRDRRASVLIIEDEVAVGRLLERVLASHRVAVVTRAREALARIEAREHFDIILCDLRMPEMTGMDFYQRLIGARPEVAARVVFMTGGAFTAGAREFLEKVPNLRLDKPIDTGLLRHIVDRSLPPS